MTDPRTCACGAVQLDDEAVHRSQWATGDGVFHVLHRTPICTIEKFVEYDVSAVKATED